MEYSQTFAMSQTVDKAKTTKKSNTDE